MTRPASQRPIPIPFSRRWLQFRMTIVPFVMFAVSVGIVAWTWYFHVAAPTVMGVVQAIRADVTAPATGALVGFHVQEYDHVEQGQALGTLHHTAPEITQQTLAMIRAEIEYLKQSMEPIVDAHRTELNYEEMRFDSMLKRVELAEIEVRLRRADTESTRMQALYESGLVSQDAYEAAQATRDALQTEARELDRVVALLENRLDTMTPPWESGQTDERLLAAISVQEERLQLAEAELQPTVLTAPLSGMISMVHRRVGETVVSGEPILTISSPESDRIVAFMKQPLTLEPEVGGTVTVRKRGGNWAYDHARILTVGGQLEPIAPVLLGRFDAFETELGLPIILSMPPSLHLRPGETVDIQF